MALVWFRSYLCDWKQSVMLNGDVSTVRHLWLRVPQGSVFGSYFSCYTWPIWANWQITVDFTLIVHADDSQLHTTSRLEASHNIRHKKSSALRSFQSIWNQIICPRICWKPTFFGVVLNVVVISWTLLQLWLQVLVFYRLHLIWGYGASTVPLG